MSKTVIDTCCLVNVCCVDDLLGFFKTCGFQWQIPSAVAAEAIYLRSPDPANITAKAQLDIAPFIAQGLLNLCALETGPETDLYVSLAAVLDDGEAMAMAIAKTRGWVLATDDRKARSEAAKLGVSMLSTPQIIRQWAEANRVSKGTIQSTLNAIQQRAKFIPSPT